MGPSIHANSSVAQCTTAVGTEFATSRMGNAYASLDSLVRAVNTRPALALCQGNSTNQILRAHAQPEGCVTQPQGCASAREISLVQVVTERDASRVALGMEHVTHSRESATVSHHTQALPVKPSTVQQTAVVMVFATC